MFIALQMSPSPQEWTHLLKRRALSLNLVHSEAHIPLHVFNLLQESYQTPPKSSLGMPVFVCSQVYVG